MGFLKNLIRSAVGEEISKAVNSVVEKTVAPAVEKLTATAAESRSEAKVEREQAPAESNAVESEEVSAAEWNGILASYPKWTFSPIRNTVIDNTEDYDSCTITVRATQRQFEQYLELLKAEGFIGDIQIQSKKINGLMYYADFSFINTGDEGDIRYLVYK